MNCLLPALVATALLAPSPGFAEEAAVTLDHRHFAAAAEDANALAEAYKRWAEDYSRDMRASMGTMFGARMGPQKVVKGAPYSAEVVTEANQALADGNVITRKTQDAVYRDGEGRTRQEVPGDGKQATVYIVDPVEGHHVVLTPGSKRAIVSRAATPEAMTRQKQVVIVNGREVKVEDGHVFVDGKETAGGKTEVVAGGKVIRVENGKVTVDGKDLKTTPEAGKGTVDKIVVKAIDANESDDGTVREEVRVQVIRSGDGLTPPPPMPPAPPIPPAGARSAPTPPPPPMPGAYSYRFESPSRLGKGVTTSLGNKDFDGVKAEGKSTVWTIAAGEIGNRNPINVTSESWYAPDLQVTVYSRYNDPRTGETVYRLAGIRRGEPSAELFRIPAGYEVKRRERETPRPQ